MLSKQKVTIKETKVKRFYQSNLESYMKPTQKKSFGIIKTKLWMYYFGSLGNDSKFKQFLRYKLGEPPIYLDTMLMESSVTAMKNYLKTEGFYYPDITYSVKHKSRKNIAKVTYQVKLNQAYHIFNTSIFAADKIIDSILTINRQESFIRNGNKLKLENLYNEQSRIENVLKNYGFFNFRKEFINYNIDTSLGNFRTSVAVTIDNPPAFNRYKVYEINQVNILINSDSLPDSGYLKLNNYNFYSNNYLLNPKVFKHNLLLQTRKLYQLNRVNRSFSRINDLQLFRTVTFNPQIENAGDTPKINYQIKLQPLPKYDLSIEPQAITTDQANIVSGATYRNYGLAAVLQLTKRNVFNNGEILQLRLRSSAEAQRGPNIPSQPLINSFENGITANLILPKFLFAERFEDKIRSQTYRSVISASAIYEQNVDWRRYLFSTSLSYQVNQQFTSYYFTPLEVSFIRTNFANKILENQSINDPYLQSIFANNLIFATKFGFTHTNYVPNKSKNFYSLRWDALEFAGNIIDLLVRTNSSSASDTGYKTIFGVPYFQYYKTYAEFRFNQYLDVNNRVAYKIAAGFAVPYGNTPDYVPFDRRFFIGGANSVRAFLPRSIGPGSFESANQIDRSGDVKIESGVEYRFNVFKKVFEGALFVDAGNIYRIKDDGRPGAAFKFNDFYESLAVGAGIGVRLNFEFLIFRIDPAIPIRDPRKPTNERWSISTAGSFAKIIESTVLNIGVGYPF